MGNTVIFAIRDDQLNNIEDLSWDSLTTGCHDSPGVTRFFVDHSKATKYNSNRIDGLAVSHYHHYSESPVIYIDSNVMHCSSILYGLDSNKMSVDEVLTYCKKTSKFMLGLTTPFSVKMLTTERPHEIQDSPHSKAHVFVFGYLTDYSHTIGDDPDVVKNIVNAIRNGSFDYLNSKITPIAMIPAGEAMLVKMHSGVFYKKTLVNALVMNELLSIKDDSPIKETANEVAFAKDFLNSLGFSLTPIAAKEKDNQVDPSFFK
jgi:hypothetical protein